VRSPPSGHVSHLQALAAAPRPGPGEPGEHALPPHNGRLSQGYVFASWRPSLVAPRVCLADMLPYLHHLLLLRDRLRLQLALPGGLFQTQHVEVWSDISDHDRAMFHYRGAASYHPEWGETSPLCHACAHGNAEAVKLLLLFGDNPNLRSKAGQRPLHVAVAQGNLEAVDALLGRSQLRPPNHPRYLAKRLGIQRRVHPGIGSHKSWCCGLDDPEAALAAKAVRVGVEGDDAAAAIAASASSGASKESTRLQNVRMALGDARYRRWCDGLDCGTFWSLHDTAVDDKEEAARRTGPPMTARSTRRQDDDDDDVGVRPLSEQDEAAAAAAAKADAIARAAAEVSAAPNAEAMLRTAESTAMDAENPEFQNQVKGMRRLLSTSRPGWYSADLSTKLEARDAAAKHMTRRLGKHSGSVTASVKRRQELGQFTRVVSDLRQGVVSNRAKFGDSLEVGLARKRDWRHIHPRLPDPMDEGNIASFAIGRKIRLNSLGHSDGHAPLLIAAEHGRAEAAMLLLSHHDPSLLHTADVPPLPPKPDQQQARALPPPEPMEIGDLAPPAISEEDDELRTAGWGGDCEALVPMAARTLVLDKRDRADPNQAPDGQATPLCVACTRGDSRIVSLLLHFGADPNKAGFKEQTPLINTAMAGHDHILCILLRSCLPRQFSLAVDEEIQRIKDRNIARRMGAVALEQAASTDDAPTDDRGEMEDDASPANILNDAMQLAKPSAGFRPSRSESPSSTGLGRSRARDAILSEWVGAIESREMAARTGKDAFARVSAVPALRKVLGMVEAERAAQRASRAAEEIPNAFVFEVTEDDLAALNR
jgi:ankyrin repeat protein